MVTIDFTRLVLRDGRTNTSSPGRMIPEATVPAKPRKSRCGRFTTWTGNRKSSRLRSEAMNTVSRKFIKVLPKYQGMSWLRSTTLSPRRAETGTNCRSGMSKRAANRA